MECTPTILMIDDNHGDHQLVQLALEQARIPARFDQALDGVEGRMLLQGAITDPGRYQLVLMDINMPRLNGLELLVWVRGQQELATVPIVILTSSDLPSDRERCLALGASRFVEKPSEFLGYVAFAQSLRSLLERPGRMVPELPGPGRVG